MNKRTFSEFCGIMDILLGEGGCPWDRMQTHASLVATFLEEAYEVVEAIHRGEALGYTPGVVDNFKEELGDVLLHVVFQAALAQKEGLFDVHDVVDAISQKLIRRHPHVFARAESTEGATPEAVLAKWEEIKQKEHEGEGVAERMRDIPKALPALMRAQKVLKLDRYSESLDAEFSEFSLALEKLEASASNTDGNLEKEEALGCLLFCAVKIAGFMGISAEMSLTNAIETFINRFESNTCIDS